LDVDLVVREASKEPVKVITASDWKTLDGLALVQRLTMDEGDRWLKRAAPALKRAVRNLKLIKGPDGEAIGRACLAPDVYTERKDPEYGVVAVGGLRASSIRFPYAIIGLFDGVATSATRDQAVPAVDDEEMARWASDQARLLKGAKPSGYRMDRVASMIRGLGGDTGPLPIALRAGRGVTLDELRGWKDIPNQIRLLDEEYSFRDGRKKISWDRDVLVIDADGSAMTLLPRDRRSRGTGWPNSKKLRLTSSETLDVNTVKFAVIEAVAHAWSSTVQEVIRTSQLSAVKQKVGKVGGKSFTSLVTHILKNPVMDSVKRGKRAGQRGS
jgi:hypothetical protein